MNVSESTGREKLLRSPGVAADSQKESWKVVRFIAPDPALLDLPLWRELAEEERFAELRERLLAAGHEKVLYES